MQIDIPVTLLYGLLTRFKIWSARQEDMHVDNLSEAGISSSDTRSRFFASSIPSIYTRTLQSACFKQGPLICKTIPSITIGVSVGMYCMVVATTVLKGLLSTVILVRTVYQLVQIKPNSACDSLHTDRLLHRRFHSKLYYHYPSVGSLGAVARTKKS